MFYLPHLSQVQRCCLQDLGLTRAVSSSVVVQVVMNLMWKTLPGFPVDGRHFTVGMVEYCMVSGYWYIEWYRYMILVKDFVQLFSWQRNPWFLRNHTQVGFEKPFHQWTTELLEDPHFQLRVNLSGSSCHPCSRGIFGTKVNLAGLLQVPFAVRRCLLQMLEMLVTNSDTKKSQRKQHDKNTWRKSGKLHELGVRC